MTKDVAVRGRQLQLNITDVHRRHIYQQQNWLDLMYFIMYNNNM